MPSPKDKNRKEEWKKKISETLKRKGIKPLFVGHKQTFITRKKISRNLKKAYQEGKRKANHISFFKGKFHTEITKRKISEANKGKHYSPNTEFKKGNNLGFKNLKWLEFGRKKGWKGSERAKKISISLKNRKNPKGSIAKLGTKNPQWLGGKSFEPYTIDWTESLRRTIRERDRYICQLCGKPQGDRIHSVHHIDYCKKNCNPDNLITLCVSCNSKVNKNRDYWKNYFYGRY